MTNKDHRGELNKLNILWTARAECARLESHIDFLRQKQESLSHVFSEPQGEELHRELEEHICQLQDEHRLWLHREGEVEQLLQEVKDPRQRAVLHLRYICLLRWGEIQEKLEEKKLYYSMRQIYNLHAQGLRAVEAVLRERGGDGVVS